MVIAVVDDDPLQHYIVKSMMSSLTPSVQILSFFNGEEILDYLVKDNVLLFPAVILLDLKMPFKDGWDFLEEFNGIRQKRQEDIRIYICTSSIDPEDSRKASSVAPLLRKPLKYQDLMEIISNGE